MSDWRPIESAPKDTAVLVCWGHIPSLPTIAALRGHRWRREINGDTLREPTHWMPLPEPPTGGDSEWPDVDDLRTTSSAGRRTYGKSPEETR